MAEYNIVTVDHARKFVKSVWNSKPDYVGIEEGCDTTDNEVLKFGRGSCLLLIDLRNVDTRFLPLGAFDLLQNRTEMCLLYCKKLAYVTTDQILKKQFEKQLEYSLFKNGTNNGKVYCSEKEAIAWLME